MILMRLIQTLNAASGGAADPMSFANIGKRFGVSRTHVGLILREAESGGLVTISGQGGQYVQLSPRLIDFFERFIATTMSLHDLCYQMALRYVEEQANQVG
jgi:DNA-binding transcriptional regulator LsrR (DeoR family)